MRFIQHYGSQSQSQMKPWSEIGWVPLHQTSKFSYWALAKASVPLLSVGVTLVALGRFLPLMMASPVPPIGLTLLIITGALLMAAGVYQGLRYVTKPTVRDGFEEDVTEIHPPIQTCWQRFCAL